MASRFWVGGTGTWDSTTTTHWASTTGGAGGATAPVTGDTITFDGSSGGGTVTVDTTINGLSFASITMDTFVGTLDFSVNNPSITITGLLSSSGTAVRTLKLGSGTFTLSGANGIILNFTTPTNFTLNAGTSTLLVNGAPVENSGTRTLILGTNLTWSTITISNSGSSGASTAINSTSGMTIGTLNLVAPLNISLGSSFTVSNPFTWAGTAFNNAISLVGANNQGSPTITAAAGSTLAWAALSDITFAGSAVNATNSLDLKGNTMNGGTITGPSGSAGSHMIGG